MANLLAICILGGAVIAMAAEISVKPAVLPPEGESPKFCTRTEIMTSYTDMDVAWTVGGLRHLLEFSKGCFLKLNLKFPVKPIPSFPGNMSLHMFNGEHGFLNIVGAFENPDPTIRYSLKVSVMVGSEVYIHNRYSSRHIANEQSGIRDYSNNFRPDFSYMNMQYNNMSMIMGPRWNSNVTFRGFKDYEGIQIRELTELAEKESIFGNTVDEFTFVFKIAALNMSSAPITEVSLCDSIPTYDELVASHPLNFSARGYGY